MNNEKSIQLHRIYGILLSVSIILAGICFIAASLYIYYTGGDEPYSREVVTDTFSYIAIPIYICMVLTIIGFVWEFFFPLSLSKKQASKNYAHILERLLQKKDLSKCDEVLLSSINKERKNRKLHIIIRTLLLCIGCLVFLFYALNGKHWIEAIKINASMIRAMLVLIPCMTVPFLYAIFTAYYNDKSFQREIELVKQVPNAILSKETIEAPTVRSNKAFYVIRYIFLLLSIILIVYGYISGGTMDVLTKAINLCRECIGLG